MHKITIGKKTQSLRKWCLELDLTYYTVWQRIYKRKSKWSILEALELSPPKSFIDKMLKQINYYPETECWNWTGNLDRHGYGKKSINNKVKSTHRIMYEYIHGKTTSDKPSILHHCDNPKCCNPKHLYAGTVQDNVNDRVKRNRSK